MVHKEVEIRQDPGGNYFIYVNGQPLTCRWTLWGAKREAKRIIKRLDHGLYRETVSVVYHNDEVKTPPCTEHLETLRRFEDAHAPRH
jgi:hypothetical protein